MLELRHRCRSFVQTRSAVGDRCVRLSDSAAEALVQQSRQPERKWGQVITVDGGRELQSLPSTNCSPARAGATICLLGRFPTHIGVYS